jgi:chromosomal replication initiator protein
VQHDSLWQAVLGEIEISVSRGSFVTWFKNTRLLKNKDNQFVVGVPNIFIKQQLERKYNQLIVDMLAKNGAQPERVEYKIHSGITTQSRTEEPEEAVLANPSPTTQPRKAVTTTQTTHPTARAYRQGLNEKYTFESFIVGSGNEFAYAACQAIAQEPGKKYNPLFIYGGVGIGKTHLIQAVGNAIINNGLGSKIVYTSSEQFVQEFIDAVRYKKNTEFASYYRNADVLIIDDIQFIAGKEKTQEEFFHTFNTLHQANKQIIMSSDKPPKDIALEERLRSRFAWGMSIDMQAPDFETRCAILQAKANTHQKVLPHAVVEYLAQHIQTNIRELEGALNQLLAFCEMRNIEPSLQIAATVFGATKARPKHLSARSVVEKTAKYFQVPLEDVLGPKRDKEIVLPRQVAMFLMRSELHLSFPKIAHELGRKDHTTAIHGIDKMQKEQAVDEELRMHIQSIKERLYA